MVEVPTRRGDGVQVRIRSDAGRWAVTTNQAGAELPIARRTFPSLQELMKRAAGVGAELALGDDDLARLWDSVGITPGGSALSRYVVPTPGMGDHATVGWDPPLGTFYAQVWMDEAERERPIGWIGTEPGEIPTLSGFLLQAGVYAVIGDDTGAQLLRDRA